MRSFALASALALAFVVSPALAQAPAQPPAAPAGVSYVVGGEPGVHALLDGIDLATADRAHALDIDPDAPANLSFVFAPPPNVTWELRTMRVAMLVGGPGSSGLAQTQDFTATLPPGFTVFVNRTIDLGSVKKVGAGLFLMRVDVLDENGTAVYSQEFHARIHGNVLLTVTGAVATGVTLATGYGLWHLLKDLREIKNARDRHRKRTRETHDASRIGKIADAAISLGADGLAGVVDIAGDASEEVERLAKRRPLAWTATGLGLGGVTLSWAQFLGYLAFDLTDTLVAAVSMGALFLGAALLAIALAKRLRKSVTLVPKGPPPREAEPPKAEEGR